MTRRIKQLAGNSQTSPEANTSETSGDSDESSEKMEEGIILKSHEEQQV